MIYLKYPLRALVAEVPIPSYPQNERAGLACMVSDGLEWVVTRCAYKRADR